MMNAVTGPCVVAAKVLRIDLDGMLHTVRAWARHMKPHREGRIVVTASIAGLRSELLSGYACVASKAAASNLVRQAPWNWRRTTCG